MPDMTPYEIVDGSLDYPARYSALLSFLAGYLTRVENLEGGWTLNINANGKRLFSLSDPTAAQDAATKAYVDNTAWTANAGNLPAQSGQNGKFLRTNGTVASWQIAGLVGASQPSADAAPTDAATAVYWFTGAADGVVLTLPNATTLSLGVNFVCGNDSGFLAGVLYQTGELLTTLRNGQAAILTLLDNSTSAGKWRVVEMDAAILNGLTALDGPQSTITSYTGNTGNTRAEVVSMATDAFVMIYRGSTNGLKLRAVTVSGRAVTIGSEYSVGTIQPDRVRIVKTNTGSFLALGSNSSTLIYVPCSVSGTTITTGTPVNASTTLTSAQSAPGFDVAAPPTLGGYGCLSWLQSDGLRTMGFSMNASSSTLASGATSTNLAVTNGTGVIAIGIPRSTANIAVVFLADNYSGGLATLKLCKITALNTTPVQAALTTVGTAAGFGAPGIDADNANFTLAQAGAPSSDKILFAYNDGGSGTTWKANVYDVNAATLGTAITTTHITIQSMVFESTTKAIILGNGNTSGTPIVKPGHFVISGNNITTQNLAAANILGVGFTSNRAFPMSLLNIDTNVYAAIINEGTSPKKGSLLILDTSGTTPTLKHRRSTTLQEPEMDLFDSSTTVEFLGDTGRRAGLVPNTGYRCLFGTYNSSGTVLGLKTLQLTKKVS